MQWLPAQLLVTLTTLLLLLLLLVMGRRRRHLLQPTLIIVAPPLLLQCRCYWSLHAPYCSTHLACACDPHNLAPECIRLVLAAHQQAQVCIR
jgi:hypothetical protein